MNVRFADLTLSEAAQRLGRYRPLVLTVVVTLGLLRVLPEDGTPVEEALEPTASATLAPAPSPSAEPVTDAATDPVPSTGVDAGIVLPRRSSRVSAVAPRPSTSPTTPAAVPSPASPGLPSRTQPEPAAPTIVQAGWATRAAGTPAGTLGVPDGSLPIANRVGQTDKASFVRLGGDRDALALSVHPDGTAGIGEPTVQACAITTETWEPVAGSGFDEAPEWDTDDCVAGAMGAGGDAWTFAIGEIDQRFGVALVPGPDAPIDFQIAFRVPS